MEVKAQRGLSEKLSKSLRRHIEGLVEQNTIVDIQIMFLPKLDSEVQFKAECRLTEKIVELGGTLPCSLYNLSDGTTIIRAQVPVGCLNEITSDSAVYRIEQTNHYTWSSG